MNTPFIATHFTKAHMNAIAQGLIASQGSQVATLEKDAARFFDIDPRQVVATNSCTNALIAGAMAWRDRKSAVFLKILFAPVLTWPGTYSWWRMAGFSWLNLVDADGDGLMQPHNLGYSDENLAIPVELWSQKIDPQSGIDFILDAAHNPFALHHKETLRYRRCKAIAYSFYETKPVAGPRGGLLVCSDLEMAARARLLIHNGANPYTMESPLHSEGGFNGQMHDAAAAVIRYDLTLLREHQRRAAEQGCAWVRLLEDNRCVRKIITGPMYTVLVLKNAKRMKRLRKDMENEGFRVGIHYPVDRWYQHGYPKAISLARRIVTLPVFLSESQAHCTKLSDLRRRFAQLLTG